MRRTILAITAVSMVIGSAASAWAIVFDSPGGYGNNSGNHYWKRVYHRNAQWPWPYICPDRAAVREPFAIMTANGWRRQNLLGQHHFNQDSNTLTESGKLKVQWIVTQAPPNYRSIFIERSVDPSVTASRVATAREYAQHITFDGRVPEVLETSLVSEGRPASVVDSINVRFQESAPPPVLPPATVLNTGQ